MYRKCDNDSLVLNKYKEVINCSEEKIQFIKELK